MSAKLDAAYSWVRQCGPSLSFCVNNLYNKVVKQVFVKAFILSIHLFMALGVLLSGRTIAFAQAPDEVADEEFFDDEEYLDDEPVEEEPQPGAPDRGRGIPRGGSRTNFNFPNGGAGDKMGGGGVSGGGSSGGPDAIEFRLVDPPQFWTPKKRKIRPIPSAQKNASQNS